MGRLLLVLVLLLVFGAACASVLRTRHAHPTENDVLRSIDAIARSSGAETLAVAFFELDSGRTLFRDERVSLHAASTMKVPVMLAIFEAIDRGELSLDDAVVVENRFVSIFDGSAYAINANDDSDDALYADIESTRPLHDLMRRMIVRSSNLATNLLIEKVGADRVMALMRSLGANDIRVLRGVEDQKAFDAGMNNTTTAYDLMLVMKAVAERKAISTAASEAMLEILRAQEFRSKIPAGVPAGVTIAHKTGEIRRISHDAAIVYPPGGSPYILVVLTRGIEDGDQASRAIAEVSRVIWEWRAAGL